MCGRLFQKVFNDIKSATISLLKNINLSRTNKTAITCRRVLIVDLFIYFENIFFL